MTFSFRYHRRANPEKYAPAHFLPPPISHSHAYPRRQMFRVAGLAFNFSAIDLPPQPAQEIAELPLPRTHTAPRRAQKQNRAEENNAGSILNMPGILPGF